MGQAQTSIWAYEAIKSRLGAKQQTVYEALKKLGIANNQELADYLGWQINCVTGRVNELRFKGFVQVEMVSKNKFGRNVKFWSVKDLNDERLGRVGNEEL